MVSRAEGVYLYDEADRPILDGASGAAGVCLGHGNRRIVARMAEQASTVRFAHASTFVTRSVLELAERLAVAMGDPTTRVYFVSGGSEGTETALKLARAYHVAAGRPDRHLVIPRIMTCYCYRCPFSLSSALSRPMVLNAIAAFLIELPTGRAPVAPEDASKVRAEGAAACSKLRRD